MEKSRPSCPLDRVRALVLSGKIRTTASALMGAARLGLDLTDMLIFVLDLRPSDFHKSMTTHAHHTVWQDVYRPHTPVGDIYLKLTVVDDVLIVSFKEL